ncbi:hypothetical protein Y033_5380 [Burkholderia pseudomallei MSHR435]|nr:hypothetical protein Y046_3810 [Burkholderia pseudomallei MSHR2990]KGX79124.1 hypothetical protein Y033_5380 [Burkholderia pseudomallei MSHR435]
MDRVIDLDVSVSRERIGRPREVFAVPRPPGFVQDADARAAVRRHEPEPPRRLAYVVNRGQMALRIDLLVDVRAAGRHPADLVEIARAERRDDPLEQFVELAAMLGVVPMRARAAVILERVDRAALVERQDLDAGQAPEPRPQHPLALQVDDRFREHHAVGRLDAAHVAAQLAERQLAAHVDLDRARGREQVGGRAAEPLADRDVAVDVERPADVVPVAPENHLRERRGLRLAARLRDDLGAAGVRHERAHRVFLDRQRDEKIGVVLEQHALQQFAERAVRDARRRSRGRDE